MSGTWGRGNGLGWESPHLSPDLLSIPHSGPLPPLLPPQPRLGSGRGDSLGWWERAGPGSRRGSSGAETRSGGPVVREGQSHSESRGRAVTEPGSQSLTLSHPSHPAVAHSHAVSHAVLCTEPWRGTAQSHTLCLTERFPGGHLQPHDPQSHSESRGLTHRLTVVHSDTVLCPDCQLLHSQSNTITASHSSHDTALVSESLGLSPLACSHHWVPSIAQHRLGHRAEAGRMAPSSMTYTHRYAVSHTVT